MPGTTVGARSDGSGGGAALDGAGTAVTALGVRSTGQTRDVWRRFRRNRLAVVGLVLVGLIVAMAAFAPWLAPYPPRRQDLMNTLARPSAAHWFGTDEVGRDNLSRVIYGSRIAMLVGLTVICLQVSVGVALGAVAGYSRRVWDSLIMRVADVFFAFPALVGATVLVLVLGRGVLPVVVALALFGWAVPARLLRGGVLAAREAEYVEAARALGASGWRIVTRHILPNTMAPVLIYATFQVGVAVVAEASLSYLGIGVGEDVPEWGNMIAAGQKFTGYLDYMWFFPSLAVVLTVLGFVFVGDGLRDALDPRLR